MAAFWAAAALWAGAGAEEVPAPLPGVRASSVPVFSSGVIRLSGTVGHGTGVAVGQPGADKGTGQGQKTEPQEYSQYNYNNLGFLFLLHFRLTPPSIIHSSLKAKALTIGFSSSLKR